VRHVLLDRANKSILIAAVEKLDLNAAAPLKNGGAQPVHTVDDAHFALLDQDRRKLCFAFSQPLNMLVVFSMQPRRIRGQQGIHRH
jgi:hypothetical protein